MSIVHCQVSETVVLRDQGVAVQVLEMGPDGVHMSVQPSDPKRLGAAGWSHPAARRLVRDELKRHAHSAAEQLNALHEQLEQRGALDLEPFVCAVYRQLLELDRSLDAMVPAESVEEWSLGSGV
ncbi:MAG: hypothetical protein U0795_24355 [Pirellulales bacterium]